MSTPSHLMNDHPGVKPRPAALSLGRVLAVSLMAALLVGGCRRSPEAAPGAGQGEAGTESATVYLDEYGIPHIYSDSEEAALYASGWLQARDRLEQVLKNYLLGMGEYSAAFGPGKNERWVRSDLEARMWRHYQVAQEHYEAKLNPTLRRHIEAFTQGIASYMEEHPEEVPAWWGDRVVDRYMPVAYSRQFIWGWPAGQAASDLRAISRRTNYDVDLRASNQFAFAPSRTTFGAAALVIDPHLAWLGRQRYWEVRIHAGDMHISGFATAGFPYVNLGHNNHIAWAHTTGGPDTADVYELELDPEDSTRYRYDGGWRALTRRDLELEVAGDPSPRSVTFWSSHHGPVVAREGSTAWAAKLAYADEIGYLESKYWFMVAEDVEGAKKALEVRQIMPQNVMVADTKGDIYYQRTGRVPVRPDGYDWNAPVPGNTSATEWLGIHDTKDLLTLLNPEGGVMQNCNIGPDTMFVGSPLTPESTRPYLYNQPAWYTHQRGASAVAWLEEREKWSEDDLLALAVDTRVYQAERWQAELVRATEGRSTLSPRAKRSLVLIRDWNGRADRDSAGAAHYWAFRFQLAEDLGEEALSALVKRVDDPLAPFRRLDHPDRSLPAAPPGHVSDSDLDLLVAALEAGAAMLAHQFDDQVVFGDIFRVGRIDNDDGVSWPVGGGSQSREGMATLRSIGFEPPQADHTRWGSRGQTSTEVVILSDPIRSYTQPPIGQSDRPESPHYRDQAEKLFSPGRLKPSWFSRADLLGEGQENDGHVVSTEEIVWRRPSPE